MTTPGRYSVELSKVKAGEVTVLGERQSFEVAAILEPSLPGASFEESLDFQRRTGELYRQVTSASVVLGKAFERIDHLERAVLETPRSDAAQLAELDGLRRQLLDVRDQILGDAVRERFQEPTVPSILGRLSTAIEGHWSSRYGPTQNHRLTVDIAERQYAEVAETLRTALDDLATLEAELEAAGAPFTPGRALPPR